MIQKKNCKLAASSVICLSDALNVVMCRSAETDSLMQKQLNSLKIDTH